MRGRQANPPLDVIRLWRKRAQWALCKLMAVPTTIRVVVLSLVLVAVFFVTNLVYASVAIYPASNGLAGNTAHRPPHLTRFPTVSVKGGGRAVR